MRAVFAFLTNLCYLPAAHSWVFALPSCSYIGLFITDFSSGFYSSLLLDDVENGILDLSFWRGYILEIELSRFIKFLFISKRYSEFRSLLSLCSWQFCSKLKVSVYVLPQQWRITKTVWKCLLCIWINFLSRLSIPL